MKTYGILGHPIAHSRSPSMHRAAFGALGIEAEYVPFDVRPEDLGEAIAGLRRLGVRGLSVTVPHKEAVLAHLDEVSDDARTLGAVNTIVVQDGTWRGENTDAPGLAVALSETRRDLVGASAVVLGAGGAARAAIAALALSGVARVHVANRTRARAIALPSPPGCRLASSGLDRASLEEAFLGAAVLVQASSAGMEGIDAPGWPDLVPLDALGSDALVVDLVYAPRPTALVARAAARGLATMDGLPMLVHQGALSFTLWTGRPAPIDAMRVAVGP